MYSIVQNIYFYTQQVYFALLKMYILYFDTVIRVKFCPSNKYLRLYISKPGQRWERRD